MKIPKFFAALASVIYLGSAIITLETFFFKIKPVYANHCGFLDPTCSHNGCSDLDVTCNTHVKPITKPAVEQLWGEAGAIGYPAAALTMRERNEIAISLDRTQKQFLRSRYGSLVDQVRVVYDSRMMDQWCALGKCTPTDSAAQTYCDRIYVKDSYKQDDAQQLILLAHEMRHSEQCRERGGEGKFGFHYFREFKRAGQTYSTNSMEVDAVNSARDFAKNVVCPQVGCDRRSPYFSNYEGWGIDLPVSVAQKQPDSKSGGACSSTYDPRPYRPGTSRWNGRIGKIAFNNGTSTDVIVTLFHPDAPTTTFDSWNVQPGKTIYLGHGNYGMDWGIQVNDSPICIVGSVSDWKSINGSHIFQTSVERVIQ